MSRIRLATRASRLALAQTRWVIDRLRSASPETTFEIVEVTTTGDTDRTSPVTTLTEVGAFVRAVQQAVLDGRADVAVHSCKDLPVAGPEGLVQHFPERESPWDVLCGARLEDLARGARVGTGSPRRAAQLALIRPDLVIAPIRGNVDTRLAKVAEGEFDAVVLAEAGLKRIGRGAEATDRFDLSTMVPAPAQGALCLESRAGDGTSDLIATIDHRPTRDTVETERLLLSLTGAGCRSALGALASRDRRRLSLTAFVDDERGPRLASAEADDPFACATAVRSELGL